MKKAGIAILCIAIAVVLVYLVAPGWILKTASDLVVSAGDFDKEEVVVDGHVRYYYDNHREDAPAMVLMHGFADRKESWFPFANKFTRQYRMIIPDMMGHGENKPHEGEDYSFAGQADFVEDLANAIDLPAFHAVGISMGGGVAGELAVRHPGHLLSVSFISPANIEGCESLSLMDQMMLKYISAEDKKAHFPLLPSTYSRANAELFKEYIFAEPIFAPNHLFKQYIKPVIKDRDFYFGVLNTFLDIETGVYRDPLDDKLADIYLPVLVIWGLDDPLLDVSCAAVFSRKLPNPPFMRLIDDCGHATIVEQPRETFEALNDFLSGL